MQREAPRETGAAAVLGAASVASGALPHAQAKAHRAMLPQREEPHRPKTETSVSHALLP